MMNLLMVSQLMVIGHSDAGMKNAEDFHTQGGLIIGFTEKKVKDSNWVDDTSWQDGLVRRLAEEQEAEASVV